LSERNPYEGIAPFEQFNIRAKIQGYFINQMERISEKLGEGGYIAEIIDWAKKFFPRRSGKLVDSIRVKIARGAGSITFVGVFPEINYEIAHSLEHFAQTGTGLHEELLRSDRIKKIPLFVVILEIGVQYAQYVNQMSGVNWTNPNTQERFIEKWMWYSSEIVKNHIIRQLSSIPPLFISVRRDQPSDYPPMALGELQKLTDVPILRETNLVEVKVEYYPIGFSRGLEGEKEPSFEVWLPGG